MKKKRIQKRHVQIGEVLARDETPCRNLALKYLHISKHFLKVRHETITVVPHKYSFRSNTSIFHTNSYIALS